MPSYSVAALLLPFGCWGQAHDALPFDPRHHFDKRCPAGVRLDAEGQQRDPTSTSTYLSKSMPAGSRVEDCAAACCGDWSCESFEFAQASAIGPFAGGWFNQDSLRGVSKITLTQTGRSLVAQALDPDAALWSLATGVLGESGLDGYLFFHPNAENNRTFTVSADGNTLFLSRVSFDPAGFSQNFTRSESAFGACTNAAPCCSFKDDIDALVVGATGVRTGVRTKLPSYTPPYAKSSAIMETVVESKMYIGINGDEFPITWGKDGNQYTGAGDNHQAGEDESPLTFFKVQGGPTEMDCDHPETHHNQPSPTCKNVTQQGASIVIGKEFTGVCPDWHSGIPNLKSSGVISIDGILYWAISCFNYGDDPVFDRQRYGPAWIITSTDYGVTWNVSATPADMFPGRLAAPRFAQYGQDNAGAPDDWVYVYFPGTTGGAAFFENNDQMLLGRVDKHQLLNRSAYQFFSGVQLDGQDSWTSDDTISEPIWSFPLMTSVQQVNYHTGAGRYIFANWAWISYDGYPRPDHTPDERNNRVGHQRTQLTLLEALKPWGPFSVFHQDDDWSGDDGSTGGYTPVIPPAWIGESDFWLVFTQCCGNYRPPLNNYNFNAQHVRFKIADRALPSLVV